MERNTTTISLIKGKLKVYSDEGVGLFDNPWDEEACIQVSEGKVPDVSPEREAPSLKMTITSKQPYREIIHADDLESFTRLYMNMAPDPYEYLHEGYLALFIDFLERKRRFLTWKSYLAPVPPHVREIREAFSGKYWWQVIRFLKEFPRSYELYDSTPALFLLLALSPFPRKEKGRLLLARQKEILSRFELPATRSFINFLRWIPVARLSEELLASLKTRYEDSEGMKYLRQLLRSGMGNCVWSCLEERVPLTPVRDTFPPQSLESRSPRDILIMERDILNYSEDFGRVKDFLEKSGERDDLIASLNRRDIGGITSLMNYLNRWDLSGSDFPEAPIPDSEDIRSIKSIGALKQEAVEMSNCCFSYLNRIFRRRYALYKMTEPERCTIGVRVFEKSFYLDQLYREGDRPVSMETYLKVCRWIDGSAERSGPANRDWKKYDSYRKYIDGGDNE